MKIAIDARMYGEKQTTGIGQYIKQITDNIFRIDEENEYIMFMREPEFSTYFPPSPRVKKILVTPRWYTYAEQFKLPFEFAKEKFDLIHYPHFNSPIFFRKKSVCTIHDVTPFLFPGHRMKSIIRRLGYRTVFAGTVNNAKKIITVSESTKNGIIKHFKIDSEKIKVIYEGVDERFKVTVENGIISSVKKRYNITGPFILFVGVWRNHKNIEGLISAYEILKKKYHIRQKLVLAGQEDKDYSNIRTMIENSGYKDCIITPGFIESKDLPSLYSGADVFVIPSFIEGFGLIALEAQKCGCPVVASNITSLPEILADSAILFDPYNKNQMAEKIYTILDNKKLQQELREKGFQNVERFSWEKAARETIEVYTER
ncbi:hypothetical protein A2533_01195 [Candidatus Falkowbacteria bacterium RIFOXYD2_FULL_35_9]|uniref:Glycosyl transferase family 1 domain-containing protein n=1 Tax=Candidatus Falkowbacteria bacterium RIFOXYC2_FULL_36_12 TaxID=1798002 RepID=A0A1F5T341_9BACT|nr:MAG: hypothetical protein A2300_02235 [Candidatus Falkowbacteria bacterium RIFOXYB2_FULL_35_7]OGF33322.1 MAG: hypothetical protein A2478_01310 [Candidatus Falkowbacteria bacterium RIFOXYC2_FULL_36_12]OGF34872.1 MAG: hypothetical protein A2223_00450 [Candidatus Falkowbacteria bacterium RIFOXYA2_FULL_35_8]OGF46734.1 MAG: hypothetical protein A2533_01195 [Candidatus Falkowbacteria bacterium RIFOXYD2_FULL_35_9]